MKSSRLEILDLARFIAAISVVFYHYLYRGWIANDLSILTFNEYNGFIKYGYLGVQLFFMISGFVIPMSTEGKTAKQFVIGRFIRLYPAYWAAIFITCFFIYTFDDGRFYISPLDSVANLTMISKLFGVSFVDGAYWTLIYEIVFYFWFLLVLLVPKVKIDYLMVIFLPLSLLSIVNLVNEHLAVFWGGSFIAYFYAGLIFYRIYKSGLNNLRIAALFTSFLLCILQVIYQIEKKNIVYGGGLSIYPAVAIVIIFYMFFIALAFENLSFIKWKFSALLGAISYPCYLLHQNIAYILFNKWGTSVNQYFLLFSVFSFILILSFIITKWVETPLSKVLKYHFNKVFS
ncbi:acyltransferase [Endozoicomonas sp. SESOKO1]|uniref:acyltransferase family protein n=1 Tax=Endozoicomonas sp. SESOKO1 TaxID=2828742 RepID=UPI002147AB4F|nr:acyltransferase [Endozoicomonas sp. SESOKO1]